MNIRAKGWPIGSDEGNGAGPAIVALVAGAVSLRMELSLGNTRWEHHSWQGTRIIVGRESLASAIIDVTTAAQPHGLVHITTDDDRSYVVPTHLFPLLEIER